MKRFAVALGLLAGAVAAGAPAQAQNYPWCLQGAKYESGYNCGFVSFEQCMETRSGLGGFCVVNNTYQPPGGASSALRRSRGSYPH